MNRQREILCVAALVFLSYRAATQGANVVVQLRDTTTIEGELLSVGDSSLALRGILEPAPDLGLAHYRQTKRIVPISEIQQVQLKVEEPGRATEVEKYTTIGIAGVLGLYAGVSIGEAATGPTRIDLLPGPPSKSNLLPVVTGLLGGVLCASLSQAIFNPALTRELSFDPGVDEQRRALCKFAREPSMREDISPARSRRTRVSGDTHNSPQEVQFLRPTS